MGYIIAECYMGFGEVITRESFFVFSKTKEFIGGMRSLESEGNE